MVVVLLARIPGLDGDAMARKWRSKPFRLVTRW
jgi:hypothetical protein